MTTLLFCCITGVYSIGHEIPLTKIEIEPLKIVETPNQIIVSTKEKDFSFTNISDRSIYTAKKIYIQTYKNVWGMIVRTELKWEN